METMLEVIGLKKSFKDKRVLRDVSFNVNKGEIMAILGPNGAGKSTTIRNIMGIMYPDEGSISFQGHADIPRHKIGYLPEERGLYKNVKVMDILLYLADLKDYPMAEAKKRALAYLKKFDLEGMENVNVEELSKGMNQKVQFISSVIHEPELLILDEPFSGLDPVSQDVFKHEIKELANNGTAILLSSHQMNLVEEMCDRVFLMQRGQKVIDGPLEDVKEKYANFKCTILGQNKLSELKHLTGVTRSEQTADRIILHLENDIDPVAWLKTLPDNLSLQELSIDRISLHEIFIDIAMDKNLLEEEGDMSA